MGTHLLSVGRTFGLLLAASLLILIPAALQAQESRGTITGRVTDSSGAVVPGVTVRLVNPDTSTGAAAQTNSAGNYTFAFVIPGGYTLTAEATGFKTWRRENVPVRVNDVVEIDIQLVPGEVSESVQVKAELPLLEAGTASVGQVVDRRRITELPIQAGNPFELVMLANGVVNATNLRARKTSSTNGTSQLVSVGNPQYSNEFTIDGIPNTFAAGQQPRVAFIPPQAAISEFRVQTTGYEAWLGHTPGSVINVNTQGGTNVYHGELHHYFANSALDAPNFFQNRAGQQKQVYQDNRYGLSFGGPAWLPKLYKGKGKTFFFYTWERNDWGLPRTFTGTVPTDDEKRGDFSALLKLGSNYQIYDPGTTTALGGGRFGRLPLKDNIIPPAQLDPVAVNIARFWARPNIAGTREGRSNYSIGTKDIDNYRVHLARIDHNFSDNHRAFLRLDYDFWDEDKQQFYLNPTTGVHLNRTNRGIALDDVYVLSASTVLNVRYGLTQQEFPEHRRSQGFDLASLGFSPGLLALTDPKTATFPLVGFNAIPPGSSITLPGSVTINAANNNGVFSGFGGWESGDGANTGMIHALQTNVTTLKGNHGLRYGADVRLYRAFAVRLPYDVAPALSYGTQYTHGPQDTSSAAPIGQEMASFLLGLPAGEMRRSASYATQERYFAFYLQDDWKLARRLTLNFGLRYEYETPMSERFDRAVKGFAYDTPNPVEAQARAAYAQNPLPELPASQFRVRGGLLFADGPNGRDLWTTPKHYFMPRFGLAYQVDQQTVIRTGYGIFLDTLGTNRSAPYQFGFTAVTPVNVSLDNGLTFVASNANPFPGGLAPALSTPGGLTTQLGRPLTFYPLNRVNPYAQRWSFGVQRQLPAGVLLEAGYVGNRGTHLQIIRDINAIPGGVLSRSPERDQATIDFLNQQFQNPFFGMDPVFTQRTSRSQLLRPYPEFGAIQVVEPAGYSWFHSLDVRAERRFSRGLTIQAAYTFSKAMEAVDYRNPFELSPYRVISSFDRPHRMVFSGIYELPFGKSRRYLTKLPRALDGVVGGWQLNALFQQQSGPPLEFGNIIFRGNLKDIPLPSDQRSVDRWFNVDAGFERNSARQLASNVRTFPLRLAGVRGDGQQKLDLSAFKGFVLRERVTIQLRAEAYNSLNHPSFDTPNTNPVGSAFGQVSSAALTTNGRQFQFALKIMF